MSSRQKSKIITSRIITIDGPAGAGKSTVAKALAKKLGFFYLDTGAMYRALTLKAMRQKIGLDDETALVRLAINTSIDFENKKEGCAVLLDGEDVSKQIRSQEVTNNTYYIARIPRLREIVVDLQRQIGRKKSIVIEGRDTGTVVFPKAKVKFFLDANLDIRSIRRVKDLKEAGQAADAKDIKVEIMQRDHSDETREAGPLRRADDAIYIDSTNMTPDQTVERMLKHIRATWISR